MNKLFFILATVFLITVGATAQSDYNKKEFFVGYSNGQVDGSAGVFTTLSTFHEIGPESFHGVNVSGVYNFSRYVGLKADVSATFGSADFSGNVGTVIVPANLTTHAKNSLYNITGGIQFKDNNVDRRLKPLGHFMVGVGHSRSDVQSSCSPAGSCNPLSIPQSRRDTGLAVVVGGGIDIKLNDRFDLRLVQFDYNPVVLKASTLHNVRIGIGIVIK